MPEKRRTAKARGLDDYHRQQLLEGPDACVLAAVGYLAPFRVAALYQLIIEEQGEVREAMRADWQRHGPDLMAWWHSGEHEIGVRPWAWVPAGGLDSLPWAAQEFGEP